MSGPAIIRKLLHLGAPRWAVERLLTDFESWPQWMSGFQSVEILERGADGRVRLRAEQRHLGQRLVQVLECTPGPGAVSQRQVSGIFRSWQARWRYFDAPAGDGTVLEVQVELDLGLLGLLVPARQIHRALDESFDQTARRANERARSLADERRESGTQPAEEALRQLLRQPVDPERIVVEIDGRRYRLEPV